MRLSVTPERVRASIYAALAVFAIGAGALLPRCVPSDAEAGLTTFGGGLQQIQDEGTTIAGITELNCVGAGIACAVDGSRSVRATITVAGSGLVGPGSSTDNAIVRWDGTGGTTFQNSQPTIDDNGNIAMGAGDTVDGRDLSQDGTKLDGLPTHAISTILDDGSSQTQRAGLNLISTADQISVTCADNSGSNRSDCTFTSVAPGSTNNLLYNSSDVITALANGTQGHQLRTNTSGALEWGFGLEMRRVALVDEPWFSAGGTIGWTSGTANSGIAPVIGTTGGDANRPGVIVLQTGTNTAGLSVISTSASMMFLSTNTYWEGNFRVTTLSDATDRYIVQYGFGDNSIGAGDPTDGLYLEYSDNLNSGNVRCCACAAATCGCQNSSTAVVAGTWHRGTITYNGTNAVCTIDGNAITAITTNLPSASTNYFGIYGAKIRKTAGTNSRDTEIDYTKVYVGLTN